MRCSWVARRSSPRSALTSGRGRTWTCSSSAHAVSPQHPGHVVVDGDPTRRLEKARAANRGGDIHLIGGVRTLETFRLLGALDELGLIVLPLLLGEGMQLTPSVSTDTGLPLKRARALPSGAVEIVYACT